MTNQNHHRERVGIQSKGTIIPASQVKFAIRDKSNLERLGLLGRE